MLIRSFIPAVLASVLNLASAGGLTTAEPDPSEERMDFKGVPLGSSISEVKEKLRLACRVDKTGQFDTICLHTRKSDRTFALQPASEIVFGFFGDRLDSVHVYLRGNYFDAAKAALDDKFGSMDCAYSLASTCTYMKNGDRAHLMYLEDRSALVEFEAAAGKAERERRRDAVSRAIRKDI